MESPTLIVCGIGSGMAHSLAELKAMGLSLVVITDKVDEDIYINADRIIECYPRSIAEVKKAVLDDGLHKANGVMTLGYENLPVIAELVKMFNVPGLSNEVALNCTHKNLRTPILARAGIRVPKHEIATGLEQAFLALNRIGYPAVVKPNDKTSSMGVSKIVSRNQAEELIKQALSLSESNAVIVEEFIEGISEHTLEGIVSDSEVFVTCISDRNYFNKEMYAPYFFEDGDTLPTSLNDEIAGNMIDIVKKAVQALCLNNTSFHCDLMITATREIVVLEVAGRMSGARFGTDLVPLSSGVHILPNIARLALGWPIIKEQLTPNKADTVILRYLPSIAGTVKEIGDLETVKSISGVYDADWEQALSVGSITHPYRSGKDMIASVITVGQTVEIAEKIAKNALNAIPIKIESHTQGGRSN